MFKKMIITVVAINMLLIGVVGAQEPGTETNQPPAAGELRERTGRMIGQYADGMLAELVETYAGMTPAEAWREIRNSETTLADLIEANGQSVDGFISEAVSNLEGKIDEAVANGDLDADRAEQMKANLTERLTEMVNGEFQPRRGERPGPAGRLMNSEMVALVESYTGMEAQDILSAIRAGDNTVADLIEANGGSVDEFVNAAIAQAETRIDEAVANGNLDADRAEQMKANLTEIITGLVNGDRPGPKPPVPAEN